MPPKALIHSFLNKNVFCPSQKNTNVGLITTFCIFLSKVGEGWVTTVAAVLVVHLHSAIDTWQRSPSFHVNEKRSVESNAGSLKHSSSKLKFLKSCLEGEKKKKGHTHKKKKTKKFLLVSVLFPLGLCHLIIKNNNKINSLYSTEGSLRREIKEWKEMKTDCLYHLWSQSQRSQINLDWWGSV